MGTRKHARKKRVRVAAIEETETREQVQLNVRVDRAMKESLDAYCLREARRLGFDLALPISTAVRRFIRDGLVQAGVGRE